jgi:hypothetical protein
MIRLVVATILAILMSHHLFLNRILVEMNEVKLQQSSLSSGLEDIAHIQTQLRELHLRMAANENYH